MSTQRSPTRLPGLSISHRLFVPRRVRIPVGRPVAVMMRNSSGKSHRLNRSSRSTGSLNDILNALDDSRTQPLGCMVCLELEASTMLRDPSGICAVSSSEG